MDYLSSLSGEELVLLASTVSISLASNLTVNELLTLATFTTTIGDNLALIATQRSS